MFQKDLISKNLLISPLKTLKVSEFLAAEGKMLNRLEALS